MATRGEVTVKKDNAETHHSVSKQRATKLGLLMYFKIPMTIVFSFVEYNII